MKRIATRAVLLAAAAAALGFGGTQAVAAPADTVEAAVCSDSWCRSRCISRGYVNGSCDYAGTCVCWET